MTSTNCHTFLAYGQDHKACILVSGTSLHSSQVTEELVLLENRPESELVRYPEEHAMRKLKSC